ncbi:MAG: hypothetical protein WCK49_00760 [Myxococcaceae bacterium]
MVALSHIRSLSDSKLSEAIIENKPSIDQFSAEQVKILKTSNFMAQDDFSKLREFEQSLRDPTGPARITETQGVISGKVRAIRDTPHDDNSLATAQNYAFLAHFKDLEPEKRKKIIENVSEYNSGYKTLLSNIDDFLKLDKTLSDDELYMFITLPENQETIKAFGTEKLEKVFDVNSKTLKKQWIHVDDGKKHYVILEPRVEENSKASAVKLSSLVQSVSKQMVTLDSVLKSIKEYSKSLDSPAHSESLEALKKRQELMAFNLGQLVANKKTSKADKAKAKKAFEELQVRILNEIKIVEFKNMLELVPGYDNIQALHIELIEAKRASKNDAEKKKFDGLLIQSRAKGKALESKPIVGLQALMEGMKEYSEYLKDEKNTPTLAELEKKQKLIEFNIQQLIEDNKARKLDRLAGIDAAMKLKADILLKIGGVGIDARFAARLQATATVKPELSHSSSVSPESQRTTPTEALLGEQVAGQLSIASQDRDKITAEEQDAFKTIKNGLQELLNSTKAKEIGEKLAKEEQRLSNIISAFSSALNDRRYTDCEKLLADAEKSFSKDSVQFARVLELQSQFKTLLQDLKKKEWQVAAVQVPIVQQAKQRALAERESNTRTSIDKEEQEAFPKIEGAAVVSLGEIQGRAALVAEQQAGRLQIVMKAEEGQRTALLQKWVEGWRGAFEDYRRNNFAAVMAHELSERMQLGLKSLESSARAGILNEYSQTSAELAAAELMGKQEAERKTAVRTMVVEHERILRESFALRNQQLSEAIQVFEGQLRAGLEAQEATDRSTILKEEIEAFGKLLQKANESSETAIRAGHVREAEHFMQMAEFQFAALKLKIAEIGTQNNGFALLLASHEAELKQIQNNLHVVQQAELEKAEGEKRLSVFKEQSTEFLKTFEQFLSEHAEIKSNQLAREAQTEFENLTRQTLESSEEIDRAPMLQTFNHVSAEIQARQILSTSEKAERETLINSLLQEHEQFLSSAIKEQETSGFKEILQQYKEMLLTAVAKQETEARNQIVDEEIQSRAALVAEQQTRQLQIAMKAEEHNRTALLQEWAKGWMGAFEDYSRKNIEHSESQAAAALMAHELSERMQLEVASLESSSRASILNEFSQVSATLAAAELMGKHVADRKTALKTIIAERKQMLEESFALKGQAVSEAIQAFEKQVREELEVQEHREKANIFFKQLQGLIKGATNLDEVNEATSSIEVAQAVYDDFGAEIQSAQQALKVKQEVLQQGELAVAETSRRLTIFNEQAVGFLRLGAREAHQKLEDLTRQAVEGAESQEKALILETFAQVSAQITAKQLMVSEETKRASLLTSETDAMVKFLLNFSDERSKLLLLEQYNEKVSTLITEEITARKDVAAAEEDERRNVTQLAQTSLKVTQKAQKDREAEQSKVVQILPEILKGIEKKIYSLESSKSVDVAAFKDVDSEIETVKLEIASLKETGVDTSGFEEELTSLLVTRYTREVERALLFIENHGYEDKWTKYQDLYNLVEDRIRKLGKIHKQNAESLKEKLRNANASIIGLKKVVSDLNTFEASLSTAETGFFALDNSLDGIETKLGPYLNTEFIQTLKTRIQECRKVIQRNAAGFEGVGLQTKKPLPRNINSLPKEQEIDDNDSDLITGRRSGIPQAVLQPSELPPGIFASMHLSPDDYKNAKARFLNICASENIREKDCVEACNLLRMLLQTNAKNNPEASPSPELVDSAKQLLIRYFNSGRRVLGGDSIEKRISRLGTRISKIVVPESIHFALNKPGIEEAVLSKSLSAIRKKYTVPGSLRCTPNSRDSKFSFPATTQVSSLIELSEAQKQKAELLQKWNISKAPIKLEDLAQLAQEGNLDPEYLRSFPNNGVQVLTDYVFPYMLCSQRQSKHDELEKANNEKPLEQQLSAEELSKQELEAVRFFRNFASAQDLLNVFSEDAPREQVKFLLRVCETVSRPMAEGGLGRSPISKQQCDIFRLIEKGARYHAPAGAGKSKAISLDAQILALTKKILHVSVSPNAKSERGVINKTVSELRRMSQEELSQCFVVLDEYDSGKYLGIQKMLTDFKIPYFEMSATQNKESIESKIGRNDYKLEAFRKRQTLGENLNLEYVIKVSGKRESLGANSSLNAIFNKAVEKINLGTETIIEVPENQAQDSSLVELQKIISSKSKHPVIIKYIDNSGKVFYSKKLADGTWRDIDVKTENISNSAIVTLYSKFGKYENKIKGLKEEKQDLEDLQEFQFRRIKDENILQGDESLVFQKAFELGAAKTNGSILVEMPEEQEADSLQERFKSFLLAQKEKPSRFAILHNNEAGNLRNLVYDSNKEPKETYLNDKDFDEYCDKNPIPTDCLYTSDARGGDFRAHSKERVKGQVIYWPTLPGETSVQAASEIVQQMTRNRLESLRIDELKKLKDQAGLTGRTLQSLNEDEFKRLISFLGRELTPIFFVTTNEVSAKDLLDESKKTQNQIDKEATQVFLHKKASQVIKQGFEEALGERLPKDFTADPTKDIATEFERAKEALWNLTEERELPVLRSLATDNTWKSRAVEHLKKLGFDQNKKPISSSLADLVTVQEKDSQPRNLGGEEFNQLVLSLEEIRQTQEAINNTKKEIENLEGSLEREQQKTQKDFSSITNLRKRIETFKTQLENLLNKSKGSSFVANEITDLQKKQFNYSMEGSLNNALRRLDNLIQMRHLQLEIEHAKIMEKRAIQFDPSKNPRISYYVAESRKSFLTEEQQKLEIERVQVRKDALAGYNNFVSTITDEFHDLLEKHGIAKGEEYLKKGGVFEVRSQQIREQINKIASDKKERIEEGLKKTSEVLSDVLSAKKEEEKEKAFELVRQNEFEPLKKLIDGILAKAKTVETGKKLKDPLEKLKELSDQYPETGISNYYNSIINKLSGTPRDVRKSSRSAKK